MTYDFEHQ